MYSFDVFDTVITRKVATPDGIFYLMQEKLCGADEIWKKSVGRDFHARRIEAERLSRLYAKGKNRCEVTLEYIYDVFQIMDDFSDGVKKELLELEIGTELENVLPVPDIIKQIRELSAKNENVILISDMYLSEAIIRKLLRICL